MELSDEVKHAAAQRTADRINLINTTIEAIDEDEWKVIDELIKNIDDELVQIESFQSMFNPIAAEHKATNRRQAQRRLKMLREWKKLMDTALVSAVEQVKAVKDMEKLSGLM